MTTVQTGANTPEVARTELVKLAELLAARIGCARGNQRLELRFDDGRLRRVDVHNQALTPAAFAAMDRSDDGHG
jgi:hypothetical protein